MMDWLTNLDWVVVMQIIGIDILLGGDNAILIALACASLAPEVRNKAIAMGTAGAVLARVLLLSVAVWLMGIQYVKIVAGAYLFYIAYQLLCSNDEDPDVAKSTSIWGAVYTVVVADVLMSLDNVLAVTSVAHSSPHALYYSIFGVVVSIPIIVYASQLVIKLMEKFPVVITLGGALLGAVAVEMILTDEFIKSQFSWVEDHLTILKFVGAVGVVLLATYAKTRETKLNQIIETV
jgi:YjbE family integral membrane protein